jgi:hypothetical protein
MELPDKEDGQVGFGCGAVLGFVFPFLGLLVVGAGFWTGLGIAASIAMVCGVVTAIFGDRAIAWILEAVAWRW